MALQRPTCTHTRVRSTDDAALIFSAVHMGLLPLITRRLDVDERAAIKPGCIYVWEERGPHAEVTGLGIERFTEGRHWGPSRVRDEFLFYYERLKQTTSSNTLVDPFVKQTHSVFINLPDGRRKWHLTAYFTQSTVDSLGTVDDIPQLRGLVVDPGLLTNCRSVKVRKGDPSGRRSPPGLPKQLSIYHGGAPRNNHELPPTPGSYSAPYVDPGSAPRPSQHSRSPYDISPVPALTAFTKDRGPFSYPPPQLPSEASPNSPQYQDHHGPFNRPVPVAHHRGWEPSDSPFTADSRYEAESPRDKPALLRTDMQSLAPPDRYSPSYYPSPPDSGVSSHSMPHSRPSSRQAIHNDYYRRSHPPYPDLHSYAPYGIPPPPTSGERSQLYAPSGQACTSSSSEPPTVSPNFEGSSDRNALSPPEPAGLYHPRPHSLASPTSCYAHIDPALRPQPSSPPRLPSLGSLLGNPSASTSITSPPSYQGPLTGSFSSTSYGPDHCGSVPHADHTQSQIPDHEGRARSKLAPLREMRRVHPYRRDVQDDHTLRSFVSPNSRGSSGSGRASPGLSWR